MNMKKSSIIADVGLAGSGKTDVTQAFVHHGYARVGFNDVFYAAFTQSGLETNEPNERKIREALREQFGMAVMALKSLSTIEKALAQQKRVVVESLYSWEEYTFMKEKFGDAFRVLAIYTPPELRYARLANRPVRPFTAQMASARDYAEIANLHKAGPIAMADWTITNLSSKEKFMKEVEALIASLT